MEKTNIEIMEEMNNNNDIVVHAVTPEGFFLYTMKEGKIAPEYLVLHHEIYNGIRPRTRVYWRPSQIPLGERYDTSKSNIETSID